MANICSREGVTRVQLAAVGLATAPTPGAPAITAVHGSQTVLSASAGPCNWSGRIAVSHCQQHVLALVGVHSLIGITNPPRLARCFHRACLLTAQLSRAGNATSCVAGKYLFEGGCYPCPTGSNRTSTDYARCTCDWDRIWVPPTSSSAASCSERLA